MRPCQPSSLFFSGSCNSIKNRMAEGSVQRATVAGGCTRKKRFTPNSTCSSDLLNLYELQPHGQNVGRPAIVACARICLFRAASRPQTALTHQIDPGENMITSLIGPSHHVLLTGRCFRPDHFDWYETPMGKVKVDTNCAANWWNNVHPLYNAKHTKDIASAPFPSILVRTSDRSDHHRYAVDERH